MPASIPDRYSLEVRLGRDGDIDEWLATDTSLDRPVLVRVLGPESSMERRRQFVESVAAAAKTSHSHLVRVFTVSLVDGGAYSVSEWTGGATVADRVAADQPIDLPDFLPNASGLAGALATLHESKSAHGDIDPSAIAYSGAHPAKLGAFGRQPVTDMEGDVKALAATLETALTGSPPGGPPPSERVDGVPRSIDGILRSGQSGKLTAAALEEALLAAPTPRPPQPETSNIPRRLLMAAIGLVVVAMALVAVGFVLSGGSAPVVPPPTSAPSTSTTSTSLVTTTLARGDVAASAPDTLDPFGEGGENDELVVNLLDDDPTTEWITESYFDPLPLLKPGVGVTVRMTGIPARLRIEGMTESTSFEVYWSNQLVDDIESWERVLIADASPSAMSFDLPAREDGFWLIWLTDLPLADDGNYRAAIAELRFSP
ncbi:MAG: protein kinase [Actinomycetota bacterium]